MPTTPATDRVLVGDVAVAITRTRAVADVTLRRGADDVAGHAEGDVAPPGRWCTVAAATLDALRQLEPVASTISLEMAGVQHIGARSLAIVTLLIALPNGDEPLAGVAPIRDAGEDDAMARAVLDATNRRLSRLR